MITKREVYNKGRYNILFISTNFNYFVENNASFNRMYNNLIYFHKHKDFNVTVLQPKREKSFEVPSLKKDIICHYFKEINIINYNLIPFIDLNPFFIIKIYQILKNHSIDLIHIDFVYGINCLRFITKIPISYNAHNVESIYYHEIEKYNPKIPSFLRTIYTKYILNLEKYAVRFVKNVNAISFIDKLKFIKIFKIPDEKVMVNSIGYNKNIYYNPIKKNIARQSLKIEEGKFIVIFQNPLLVYSVVMQLKPESLRGR
ncbi:hypothetical protein LCGC14_1362300 [marine sediment metagenome]|uniref:Glycosyltransferase subfamily 4-like N-terminal domain-containing protein n=1 Tax=marine sediment metagenome TaxID=412755 RepID=A0A0F9KTT6_9ZZZZ